MCCLITLPAIAKNTILIVGDSLSAGYGIELKQSWVKLLQDRLSEEKYDYKVVNISISGSTTSNGLAKLPAALKKYQPHVTIIELGANDGLRGLDINVIKNNLVQMVELAKSANSKVLLIGVRLPPNYGAAYTQEFQAIFPDLGKYYNVNVVPFFLAKVDENPIFFQADRIHPTAAAQNQMLENVWVILKNMLQK